MGIGDGLGNLWGLLGQQGYQQQQVAATANTASSLWNYVNVGYGSSYIAPDRCKSFGDEFGPLAKEGDIESPLQWLDRRVNEMRVRL